MKKQEEILNYLKTVETANLDMIYAKVSWSYYCNHKKHLGYILSTMVKNGEIERTKKGWFKFSQIRRKSIEENENQLNLF